MNKEEQESKLKKLIKERADSQWISAIGLILVVACSIFLVFVLFLMEG